MAKRKEQCDCEKEQACNCETNEKECNCQHEGCNCEHEQCNCEEHECNCEDCNCETAQCDCEETQANLALQYLNIARQVQADFDNYRKRTQENLKNARIDGLVDAVKTILPAVDVFETALKQVTDEQSKQGIIMVKNQIEKSISDLGVTRIESVGKQFNPHFHNAVMIENNSELDDDTIVEEFQAGYMYKDKVIRYSQVKVNKN